MLFRSTSGPNAGLVRPDNRPLDSNGQATFSYVDRGGAGVDHIQAAAIGPTPVLKKIQLAAGTVTWTSSYCADVTFIMATGSGDIPNGDQVPALPAVNPRSHLKRTLQEVDGVNEHLYRNFLLNLSGGTSVAPVVVNYRPLSVEALTIGVLPRSLAQAITVPSQIGRAHV